MNGKMENVKRKLKKKKNRFEKLRLTHIINKYNNYLLRVLRNITEINNYTFLQYHCLIALFSQKKIK